MKVQQLTHWVLRIAPVVPLGLVLASPRDARQDDFALSPYAILREADAKAPTAALSAAVVEDRYGLHRFVATVDSSAVDIFTSTANGGSGNPPAPFCSTTQGEKCSTDPEANCSVKGSGNCSTDTESGSKLQQCSATRNEGVNCSVLSMGSESPSGKCSAMGSNAGGKNQCSTFGAAVTVPQCSVIGGAARNSGSCSVFQNDDSQQWCSTSTLLSRCSVQSGTKGKCTTLSSGSSIMRCSAQVAGAANCSVFTGQEPTATRPARGDCQGTAN